MTLSIKPAAARTFRSLRVYNYRLFFFSQVISMSGTWMQSVAQSWLVLQLTGSGVDLGITVGLQFGPVLVLGAWAGVLADRIDKRRFMVFTQSAMVVLAVALGAVTATHVVTVWMIWVLAGLMGAAVALDLPARQSFIAEMVGPDDLANAVGLNSVIINASRIVGPAVAGLLIVGVGVAPCFFLNAASFLAVIAALLLMRPGELLRGKPVPRERGQVRAGLAYAWRTPALRIPLLMMAVVSTLGYNFSVLLPLMAKDAYGRGPGAYSALTAAMGVGALVGALLLASRTRPSRRLLVASTFIFGAATLALAAAPGLWLGIVVLLPLGAAAVFFIASTNTLLQLNSEASLRGRVMALWTIVFLGSTPIGGPLAGVLARGLGVRWAVAIGGVAALATGFAAAAALRRQRLTEAGAEAPETVTCLPDDPDEGPAFDVARAVAEEPGAGAQEPSSESRHVADVANR